MSLSARSVIGSLMTAILTLALTGCGREEIPYTPRPAPTVPIAMPPVPNIPQRPVKVGDAYTVWGASYYLRSRVHTKKIAGEQIAIEGYITKTNLPDAPECAVHKGGKADPEDCKPPIPSFWLGDTKDAPVKDCIEVLGWASNYAQLYDAIEEIDTKKEDAEPMDTFWGKPIPVPIPNVGAKARVTGRYGTTFTGSSTGTEADPIMGILSFQKIDYIEPPPEPATLPGMDDKGKK